jgi:hypothetical protein
VPFGRRIIRLRLLKNNALNDPNPGWKSRAGKYIEGAEKRPSRLWMEVIQDEDDNAFGRLNGDRRFPLPVCASPAEG